MIQEIKGIFYFLLYSPNSLFSLSLADNGGLDHEIFRDRNDIERRDIERVGILGHLIFHLGIVINILAKASRADFPCVLRNKQVLLIAFLGIMMEVLLWSMGKNIEEMFYGA